MTASAKGTGQPVDPFASKRRAVAFIIGGLLLGATAASLSMGAVTIDPAEVVAVILRKAGVAGGLEPSTQATAVVWAIRLPRVLMGIEVGAMLAMAGIVLQGVFRNPLADPQILGIGPGASLGAVIGSVAGAAQGAIAGGAIAGLLTALVVHRLGRGRGNQPNRFILTGVAFSAALTAWVGFIVFGADRTKVPPIEFWLLGSLSGSTWRTVATTLAVGGLGILGLATAARTLDLLSLGETEARHLGVDVDFVTTILLMGVGIVAGAAAGAVGVVGFVGLLVPHVVRWFTGPSHRPLMIAGLLAGALFVVLADLAARTAISPIELPVGLVTAVIGGPFFVWLVSRAQRT